MHLIPVTPFDDPVGSRFMPPMNAEDHNVAKPPAQVAAAIHEPAPPTRTLADELRAALQRSGEFEARDQDLRAELQKLAAQRDQLAARAADVAGEIELRRDAQIDAVLDGTTAKKSGLAELQENTQAIAAAQKLVADREGEAMAEMQQLQRLRAEHETNVFGDIRWRIALARYARGIEGLIPLAHELATLSRVQRRSFMPGVGLMIDPRASDIVGVPLSIALEQSRNLGNVDEVQQ